VPPGPGVIGFLSVHIHWYVTMAYFGWAAIEIIRIFLGKRSHVAFVYFAEVWHTRVR
jgi:hypothetical protein